MHGARADFRNFRPDVHHVCAGHGSLLVQDIHCRELGRHRRHHWVGLCFRIHARQAHCYQIRVTGSAHGVARHNEDSSSSRRRRDRRFDPGREGWCGNVGLFVRVCVRARLGCTFYGTVVPAKESRGVGCRGRRCNQRASLRHRHRRN